MNQYYLYKCPKTTTCSSPRLNFLLIQFRMCGSPYFLVSLDGSIPGNKMPGPTSYASPFFTLIHKKTNETLNRVTHKECDLNATTIELLSNILTKYVHIETFSLIFLRLKND